MGRGFDLKFRTICLNPSSPLNGRTLRFLRYPELSEKLSSLTVTTPTIEKQIEECLVAEFEPVFRYNRNNTRTEVRYARAAMASNLNKHDCSLFLFPTLTLAQIKKRLAASGQTLNDQENNAELRRAGLWLNKAVHRFFSGEYRLDDFPYPTKIESNPSFLKKHERALWSGWHIVDDGYRAGKVYPALDYAKRPLAYHAFADLMDALVAPPAILPPSRRHPVDATFLPFSIPEKQTPHP